MDYENREEVRLTREMVRIESSNPGVYESAMADFVCHWLKTNTPAEVIREPVHEGRDNIVARLRGASQAHNLTYIGHMDTMPTGSGWTHPPLEAELSGGKIWGRGACTVPPSIWPDGKSP